MTFLYFIFLDCLILIQQSIEGGFLPPTLYDTKNLGEGISIPYFFDLDKDKNFTLASRLYTSENPLFLGEYHQAFKNSSLL